MLLPCLAVVVVGGGQGENFLCFEVFCFKGGGCRERGRRKEGRKGGREGGRVLEELVA